MTGEITWMKASDRYRTFDTTAATTGRIPACVPDLFTFPAKERL